MNTKKIIVAKFGGTSINHLGYPGVIDKLLLDFPNKKIVCVLSAPYGVTKELISQFEHKININTAGSGKHADEMKVLYNKCLQEYDLLVSQGEVNSIIDASIAAKSKGISCVALTGAQAGIQSNSSHGAAIIEHVSTETLKEALEGNSIVFVAGFQGATTRGFITTLGRGASDLTAIALANAIGNSDVYIYTDVPAIYSSDPRKIDPDNLKEIKKINFEEALEIASFGGKVIHDRAVSLAQKYGTRIHIRESTSKTTKTGTIICSKYEAINNKYKPLIKACISREDISLFSIYLPHKPGVTEKVIQALSKKEISLSSMFQNFSNDGGGCIEFVISSENEIVFEHEIGELKKNGFIYNFDIDRNLCEVSVIGEGLEEAKGFLHSFQSLFSSRKLKTHSVYTNGIRVSALIKKSGYKEHFQSIYQDCSFYM